MDFWYQQKQGLKSFLLLPFAKLYKSLAYSKYEKDLKKSYQVTNLNIPVIIVGNITVGGTGKTPMVRFLFRFLTAMGFKVGVISRGYGGTYKGVHHLQEGDLPSLVGDEMAMQYAYAQRQGLTNLEFVVARDRVQAALKAQELGCNFIIADDGMQHYKLPRHLEIAVIGPRGLGNKKFIPAGPLREDPQRLRKVDFIINNSQDLSLGGYPMVQENLGLVPVKDIFTPEQACSFTQMQAYWQEIISNIDPSKISLPTPELWNLWQEEFESQTKDCDQQEDGNTCSNVFELSFIDLQLHLNKQSYANLLNKTFSPQFKNQIPPAIVQYSFPKVVALCAIGYPQGFKQTLENLGFEVVHLWSFKDHYQFKQEDFTKFYQQHPELKDLPLIVTEKDAIKLHHLELPELTFYLERQGTFTQDSHWLDSLKKRIINIYTSGAL